MHTHAAMASSKHCLAILGRLHKVLQVLQLFATGSSVVALDDLGCFVSPNCDSSSTSGVSQMYLSRSWEPNSRIAWQVSHKMGLELSNTEVMWLLGGSRWIDWELNLTTDPGLSCRLAPQKLSDLSSLVEGKVCPSPSSNSWHWTIYQRQTPCGWLLIGSTPSIEWLPNETIRASVTEAFGFSDWWVMLAARNVSAIATVLQRERTASCLAVSDLYLGWLSRIWRAIFWGRVETAEQPARRMEST